MREKKRRIPTREKDAKRKSVCPTEERKKGEKTSRRKTEEKKEPPEVPRYR